MTYALEELASMLKQVRERKGLSQRDLSRTSGVPQGQISKIENGAVDLRVSSLLALARALELEPVLVPHRVLGAVQTVVSGGGGDSARRPAYSLDGDDHE